MWQIVQDMLLSLLLSLLSATFTVSGRNSVAPSGDLPEGCNFAYSSSASTGQKGQMTAGNSTTLRLSGWGGCTIQSVTLSMHSNTSSGAGSLQMTIGGSLVWEIPAANFADVAWNEAYSSAFVPVSHDCHYHVGYNDTITIRIEATQNSLYIASYTVSYTPAPPQPYRVSFVSGLGHNPPACQENTPREGILLPCQADTAQWRFIGWSETEALEDEPCPQLFSPNSRYFPRHHCTLYAVYSDTTTTPKQVLQPQSGRYAFIYNSPYWSPCALTGGVVPAVQDGETRYHVIETQSVAMDTTATGELFLLSSVLPEMIFQLDILSDTTLTITHEATKTGIGYKGKDLSAAHSEWKYRLLSDHSLMLYYNIKDKYYCLFVSPVEDTDGNALFAYTSTFNISTPLTANGIRLFPVTSATCTTWPFGKYDALSDTSPDNPYTSELIIPFGPHELHIREGKKYLHLINR